ncbi:hypothetical protein V8C34DRAFT_297576 [Trichoderma compactum]
MSGQYPNDSDHDSNNDLDDDEFNTMASQTSGGMGPVPMQSYPGDDAMMFISNWQYPEPDNEHWAPNNEAPPPCPADQAEMAGSLRGVGRLFDNQPAGDAAYVSPEVLSTAVDGAQDTPSHVPANTPATADGQPPGQRRPRARPPDSQVWDHHKTNIHYFYMKRNFTLAATMQLMQADYQFQATEKMYKDKFKQWKWSKNLPKAIAARMLNIAHQRRPKRTVFWRNDRMWPIKRIKKLLSRHSAEEDSSIQQGSSIPDDFTYTTPSSGNTDTESVSENLHRTDGDLDMADAANADTTEDLRKFLDEGFCRTNSTPEVLYSRVQGAVKAIEEATCHHEEAESAFRDAFSYYRHHCSPTHGKTLEIGYLLASFYVKIGRVNDAHCILDWMTKEHCGDTKSCRAGTITHLLSTIGILRQTQRDEEANLLTIHLLKHHQTPEADLFLLQTPSRPRVGLSEMIEELIASSEPEKLATMSNILERLSTDSKNHQLLQDLLPRYIQKCENQPTLEKHAIHSGCIFAATLAKSAHFPMAINILNEAERLLDPFLKRNIESQCPLELSTLKLARRLAFTFVEANDPDACLRVLNAVLQHMDFDKDKDIGVGYGLSVCNFLMSTASELHSKGSCEQSLAWTNQAFLKSKSLFGDNHQCTKWIEEVMITCGMDIYLVGLSGTIMDVLDWE